MRATKLIVKNELLTEAVFKMAKDNNVQNQKEMVELLLKSGLLIPVKIMPQAKKDAKGNYKLTAKHRVAYATIKSEAYANDPDANYYMAFTDTNEIKAWAGNRNIDTFVARFEDYAVMLMQPGAMCKGFVINPATANVLITTEAVKQIIREQESK